MWQNSHCLRALRFASVDSLTRGKVYSVEVIKTLNYIMKGEK